MPSYVVTGAGKGLGYEFIRQYSTIPDAHVFGLVRDVATAEKKVQKDELKNVHILQADVTDRTALKAAATKIGEIVPAVDYLINNAAFLDVGTAFDPMSDFDGKEDVLEYGLLESFRVNTVGVVNTINAFLPLIKKSTVKKVITITSGFADEALTTQYEVWESGPYSVSKAAVNMVSAKYAARHAKRDGILFMCLSPGFVVTGNDAAPPPDSELPAKFLKAYPHFKGPIMPDESISKMREVIDRASATNEFSGSFVSHFGNKQWL